MNAEIAFVIAALLLFGMLWLYLNACMRDCSHGVRDEKGRLIERRLRDADRRRGSPAPLPEGQRERRTNYGRRESDSKYR